MNRVCNGTLNIADLKMHQLVRELHGKHEPWINTLHSLYKEIDPNIGITAFVYHILKPALESTQ